MLFARPLRLALVGAALLLGQVQATVQFPSCVTNCITSSYCEADSAKCMCKAAREIFLDSVISCLFFNCKSDLRTFDSSFLSPIEEFCDDSGRDIPSSKLRAASSAASSYIAKLPPLTTAKPTTSFSASPTPTPKTTPATTPKSSSSTLASSSAKPTATENDDDSSPSSTSAADESSTSTPAAETTAAPTLIVAPTTATQRPATSSGSSGSGSGGSGFDTNPFGSSGSSAGSTVRPIVSLLGLPMAVVVTMLAMR
ncbi:hypothetical protein NEMBOFW57_002331 [Staphylotrichum longicolle]|uniref:Extracellular membrane protein CFEM domain-containing protein n=1 Tax=Staphylotrichum longicolle TaxID=669026 RepID=A0AAD4F3A4_9PEZI|nr:hypothetical protein NEMBOFW57_002331 [Staphylotrichum longicolle]